MTDIYYFKKGHQVITNRSLYLRYN